MTVINLTSVLRNLDGSPMKESEDENAKDADLKSVILKTCHVTLRGDENLTADQKIKIALLAQRSYGDHEVEFTVEEIALLKDRISRTYGPIVVLRAFEILDPASIPKS